MSFVYPAIFSLRRNRRGALASGCYYSRRAEERAQLPVKYDPRLLHAALCGKQQLTWDYARDDRREVAPLDQSFIRISERSGRAARAKTGLVGLRATFQQRRRRCTGLESKRVRSDIQEAENVRTEASQRPEGLYLLTDETRGRGDEG